MTSAVERKIYRNDKQESYANSRKQLSPKTNEHLLLAGYVNR